jgi:hypothetical protein
VVRDGTTALALRSLQLREDLMLTTVIVANGPDDLVLPHVRARLEQAGPHRVNWTGLTPTGAEDIREANFRSWKEAEYQPPDDSEEDVQENQPPDDFEEGRPKDRPLDDPEEAPPDYQPPAEEDPSEREC